MDNIEQISNCTSPSSNTEKSIKRQAHSPIQTESKRVVDDAKHQDTIQTLDKLYPSHKRKHLEKTYRTSTNSIEVTHQQLKDSTAKLKSPCISPQPQFHFNNAQQMHGQHQLDASYKSYSSNLFNQNLNAPKNTQYSPMFFNSLPASTSPQFNYQYLHDNSASYAAAAAAAAAAACSLPFPYRQNPMTMSDVYNQLQFSYFPFTASTQPSSTATQSSNKIQ
jgi:hypothetical protein